ncbi:MAG TPA: tetratricopeptide repeat protein [Planctomycetota bacterium]|nr:tetratricopeptide repeat protein [Planctomycetota bacterium]
MTKAVLRKSVVAALLVMLGALNACSYWHGDLERIVDQSERDFRRDVAGPFTEVPMRTVIANPTAYKYIDVRFDAILNKVGEKAFVPFVTTFTAERFMSFSAWPADAKLWTAEDRSKSHPLFFVSKSGPNIHDLATAGRFSLVRISGKVMGDYEMQAWFEVNRVEVIEPNVYTDEALTDLAIAKQAMADKKPAVAIRHYENALGGIWTTGLRLEIHLTLARLYEGRGDLEAALRHYNGALSNAPDNDEAQKGHDRVKAALSGQPAAPQQ